jgi:23S rRNA (cytosine1962-C5)-methyltransferase
MARRVLRCRTVLRLSLAKEVSDSIRRGHPWIFRPALHPPRQPVAPGQLALIERRGKAIAIGFADPESPIAARVLTLDVNESINEAWVCRRVERAVALRRCAPSLAHCNAMRVIHGENDHLPGLVLDCYAGFGVVQFDGAGARAMWQPYVEAIARVAGVQLARPRLVTIEENGARFEVDLERGQKTGFYLDQRDNRLRAGAACAGARVLNLFCYSGGFTVQAALGGALAVTSVDRAKPAVDAVARNLALNDLDVAAHELVSSDAFEFLEDARRRQRRWDVVTCDPPSFAPSARVRAKALSAYRRLNRLAVDAVEPGGMLITASCSSHITMDDMLDIAADATAERGGRVLAMTGPGEDHPVLPGFREGLYLKCLFVRL